MCSLILRPEAEAEVEDASAFLPDRGDGGCLMYVESYILGGAFHEGRSWAGSTVR
jgi:hypothetical protein